MNELDNYITAEDADRVITNLRAVNEQLLDVLAQRDDLQAQLNARIEELRDVVEERDEARRVARLTTQYPYENRADGTMICPACKFCGEISPDWDEENVVHTDDCPLKIIKGWNDEQE